MAFSIEAKTFHSSISACRRKGRAGGDPCQGRRGRQGDGGQGQEAGNGEEGAG